LEQIGELFGDQSVHLVDDTTKHTEGYEEKTVGGVDEKSSS